MNATCQSYFGFIAKVETRAPREALGFLFRGTLATAARLKIRAILKTRKGNAPHRPPNPDGSQEPPEGPAAEGWWNDPSFWMLLIH